MKKLLFRVYAFAFMSLCCVLQTLGQSPDAVNYQAVARNSSTGVELSNTTLYVVVKILDGSPQGTIAYQEEHPSVQTNLYGLFNIQIGEGQDVTGSFPDLNWSASKYWLEIDIDAGEGLRTMGSMALLSVPYALHAETATHINDADADPSNELITDFSLADDGNIAITEGGITRSINLSNFSDADGDPSNELVEDLIFSEDSRDLTLVQQGESITVNLGSVNDSDADSTNELIEAWSFEEGILNFTEGGTQYSVDFNTLNQDDADADPENEIIEDWYFDGSLLTFTESGNSFELDLSSLNTDDADADPENELVEDFTFNTTTRDLTIVQEGDDKSVNIGSIDDADADPENELVEDFTFNTTTRDLTIVQEGDDKTVNIGSIDDADADPENEIIENWIYNAGVISFSEGGNDYSFNLNDADYDPNNEKIDAGFPRIIGTTLEISEGGTLKTVDLSGLLKWQSGAGKIYTETENVAIGSATPSAQLSVTQRSGNTGSLLRVENSSSNAVIDANSSKVGLGGNIGPNTIQIQGSVGYNVKVLTSGQIYTVSDTDYYIVCRVTSTNDINLTLPDPATCTGRVLTIKRIAGGSGRVNFNWGSGVYVDYSLSPIGYLPQPVLLGNLNTLSVVSMGSDGWISILAI